MSETTPSKVETILRRIPSVDELLGGQEAQALLAVYPRWAVLEAIREVLAARRRQILRGEVSLGRPKPWWRPGPLVGPWRRWRPRRLALRSRPS